MRKRTSFPPSREVLLDKVYHYNSKYRNIIANLSYRAPDKSINPIALRKAKTTNYNFGISECNRVKDNSKGIFLISQQIHML